MGASFTNFHVRSTASAATAAVSELTTSRGYISPASSGWVTIYLEETESQDVEVLCRIAAALSKALATDVLACLVHDSDIAMYWLHRNGELVDELNSCPDYFEEVDEEVKERVRGRTEALLPLCQPGTAPGTVDSILHPGDAYPLFAEEILSELAPLLGIDAGRMSLGFEYFVTDAAEVLPDAGDFIPLGKARKIRLKARPQQSTGVAPDMFPVAVGMLTQCWNKLPESPFHALGNFPGAGSAEQLQASFDREARKFWKQSALDGKPTFEALKAARDHGPGALAQLLAERVPSQLQDIGIQAVIQGSEEYLCELLKRGLKPDGLNFNGKSSPLRAAARFGPDSKIYTMLKGVKGQ